MDKHLILKIGGSIFDKEEILTHFLTSLTKNFFKYYRKNNISHNNSLSSSKKILIISGGGQNVMKLREKYQKDPNPNKNEEYHWEAIKIMDENVKNIFKKCKNLIKSSDLIDLFYLVSDIKQFIDHSDGIFFFCPYLDLKVKNPKQLKHSWSTTSDSIAVYYSHIIDAKFTVLLKDISFLKYQNKTFPSIDSLHLKNIMENSGYLKNIEKHLGKGTKFPVDPLVPDLINIYKKKVALLNGMNYEKIDSFFLNYFNSDNNELHDFGTVINP